MGVDFSIQRLKRRKQSRSRVELPEIEAHFASTEYPRFLSQLAEDAGLGTTWREFQNARDALGKRMTEVLFAAFDPAAPAPPNEKHRKRSRKAPVNPLDSDPQMISLRRKVDEAKHAVEQQTEQEPLVEMILLWTDDMNLSSDACRRIAPRLREVVHEWEKAPEGYVGWRERALEIADAMGLAGQHPDLVLHVSS